MIKIMPSWGNLIPTCSFIRRVVSQNRLGAGMFHKAVCFFPYAIRPLKEYKIQYYNFQLYRRIPTRSMSTQTIGLNMNIISLNDEKSNYLKKLSDAVHLLVDLEEKTEGMQRDLVTVFMMSIGELFLEYFQFDLSLAQEFGRTHEKLLKSGENFFWTYVSYAENSLNGFEGGGEWEKASFARTNIEAFNAMFKGILNPLETETIEQYMQETNKRYKWVEPDHIPKNVPKSHWWWFV